MVGKLRLVIADDDDMAREAYAAFCGRQPGLELIGEAHDGAEAVSLYFELKPDVVLMDLQMPKMSGIEAIKAICARDSRACIVALTTFGTPNYITPALQAGASGYLLKDTGGEALARGIQDAYDGQMPLSPAVRLALVNDVRGGVPAPATQEAMLSPREKELVTWLAQGFGNREIAEHMYLSEGSVKQYMNHVGDKLGVRSRTQILVRSLQLGLVDLGSLPLV